MNSKAQCKRTQCCWAQQCCDLLPPFAWNHNKNINSQKTNLQIHQKPCALLPHPFCSGVFILGLLQYFLQICRLFRNGVDLDLLQDFEGETSSYVSVFAVTTSADLATT